MHVGGYKNANNCPIGAGGRRDWSFSLFDCFSSWGLCTYQLKADHQLVGRATFNILTDPLSSPFQPQAVRPIGARAGTVARTSSACATCKSTAPLCLVAANLAYLD